ncbi:MAG: hypothetical protein WBE26_11035 [Phycisphaerae bacterium]
MSATLGVPESMLEAVATFVGAEALPLNVVDVVVGSDATVQVVQSEGRRPSTPSVLQAGGWIACGTAHNIAVKLDISPRKVGKLLNHLDIKVRECELGCFE